jgi:hypothetical protein
VEGPKSDASEMAGDIEPKNDHDRNGTPAGIKSKIDRT